MCLTLLFIGQDSKPITHHHNHRFDKVNKNTGQRVKKLQFEDFEWYENPKPTEQVDIPGHVEGDRRQPKRQTQPKRLSRSEQGHVNVDAETHDNMDGFTVAYPYSRSRRLPRRNQGYRTR